MKVIQLGEFGTTELLVVILIPAILIFALGYYIGLAKGRKEKS